jgi:hypothetical protein
MDPRRSFYLAARQDDIDVPDSNATWVGTTDITYIRPANDNLRVKDRISARYGTLLRRLIACIASVGRIMRSGMVVSPHQECQLRIDVGSGAVPGKLN